MKSPQMIFLLGGHDLEMAEIRRIVKECGMECKDHGLSWSNSKLSAYNKILNQKVYSYAVDVAFFGISGRAIDKQLFDQIKKT